EMRRRAPSRLILKVDIGERVAVRVADDVAVLAEFQVGIVDGPGRREAALSHRGTRRSKVGTKRSNSGQHGVALARSGQVVRRSSGATSSTAAGSGGAQASAPDLVMRVA